MKTAVMPVGGLDTSPGSEARAIIEDLIDGGCEVEF